LLGNNSIQELNFLSFWGLEYSLETLDLSYNEFRRVPFEALRLLRNLRSLSLTGNVISKLEHYDFGFMRKLEVLAVDHNPIISIDRHAFVGTQLFLLIMDHTRLQDRLDVFPLNDLTYAACLFRQQLSHSPNNLPAKNCQLLNEHVAPSAGLMPTEARVNY